MIHIFLKDALVSSAVGERGEAREGQDVVDMSSGLCLKFRDELSEMPWSSKLNTSGSSDDSFHSFISLENVF